MCIICAKPAKTAMPSETTLRSCWDRNPDGAGIMFVSDGKVVIRKGFMTYKAFTDGLAEIRKTVDLDKVPAVIHFRITTHGGTKPENTHPFPVTDSIALLGNVRSACSIGIAHNGIIPITPRKGISDTMEYVATQLAPLNKALPSWYKNRDALDLVNNAIQSRMAVLVSDGSLVTIGSFITDDNGVMYSNDSFRKPRYSYSYSYSKGDNLPWSSGKTKTTKKSSAKKAEPKPTEKSLMWLTVAHDDAFVMSETNHFLDGGEFLVDSDNFVYYYDTTLDAAVKKPGYRAFYGTGLPLRYSALLASHEYVADLDG